jgi:hypothetical protein
MSLPTNVEAELGCDNFPIGSKLSLCRAGVMLSCYLFWLGLCLSQTLNSLSTAHQHKHPTILNSQFSVNMPIGRWKMDDDLQVCVNERNPPISK